MRSKFRTLSASRSDTSQIFTLILTKVFIFNIKFPVYRGVIASISQQRSALGDNTRFVQEKDEKDVFEVVNLILSQK